MVEVATVAMKGSSVSAPISEVAMVGSETMWITELPARGDDGRDFRRELDRRGPFYNSIHRHAQALLTLLMQSSGCLALHPVHERCCAGY